jgi:hypothetical protein
LIVSGLRTVGSAPELYRVLRIDRESIALAAFTALLKNR